MRLPAAAKEGDYGALALLVGPPLLRGGSPGLRHCGGRRDCVVISLVHANVAAVCE